MEPVETPRIYSGRYELTHLIARGGMAQVYRAMDRQLERPVALKVLFPELSVDRTFVERFRREAQAAANLSHPNIVPVFDWGEDDGSYFIVMEYVQGRPLSAVLRDPQRLSPRQIATIGAGVAAALAFAHRHGVVHRDVKPGNILITPDGDVKVTDFGIARAMNTEESLTQTGAVMGTAAYFSPEQAEGKGVDSRSDIYSLGVVLYEMAVGRPPFTGDSPVAVASKHVRDQPVLPRQANPTVPPALEAVIMKAMAKNPDDRYGSAEELRADLLRFADGRPVEAGDPGLTSVMTAVGATQAVPMTTGRTMAVPALRAAHRPGGSRAQEAHAQPDHPAGRAPGGPRRHRLLPPALRRGLRQQRDRARRRRPHGRPGHADPPRRQSHRGQLHGQDEQHHQGRRPVDRPQGGGVGREELRGGSGRQRRPEHPHRRRPLGAGEAADPGHRAPPNRQSRLHRPQRDQQPVGGHRAEPGSDSGHQDPRDTQGGPDGLGHAEHRSPCRA